MSAKRIEEVIQDVLQDDAQRGALDFVAHLRASGVPLEEESETYWEAKYQDESVCFLWVSGDADAPGPWTIWSDQVPGTWATWPEGEATGEYVEFPIDDSIKETAWANVNVCANCGGCSVPGRRKTVLGKEFDNLCNSTMAFTNPDTAAVACAKKMVDVRIGDILGTKKS